MSVGVYRVRKLAVGMSAISAPFEGKMAEVHGNRTHLPSG